MIDGRSLLPSLRTAAEGGSRRGGEEGRWVGGWFGWWGGVGWLRCDMVSVWSFGSSAGWAANPSARRQQATERGFAGLGLSRRGAVLIRYCVARGSRLTADQRRQWRPRETHSLQPAPSSGTSSYSAAAASPAERRQIAPRFPRLCRALRVLLATATAPSCAAPRLDGWPLSSPPSSWAASDRPGGGRFFVVLVLF